MILTSVSHTQPTMIERTVLRSILIPMGIEAMWEKQSGNGAFEKK